MDKDAETTEQRLQASTPWGAGRVLSYAAEGNRYFLFGMHDLEFR